MPNVIAYLRISTDAQDVANQRRGVAEYCAARDWLPGYVEDTASGRTPWRERALGQILDRMQRGDVLVCSEVSRLARSTLQVLEVCKIAAERGLQLHIVKTGQVIDDSMQSKVLTTMLALAGEIERDMISARTRETLGRLKAEGVQLGRPTGKAERLKLDDKADQIDNLMRCGVALRAIARVLQCSPQTLHTWLSIRRPDGLPEIKPKKGAAAAERAIADAQQAQQLTQAPKPATAPRKRAKRAP